jgi:hypothetical protein
MKLRKIFSLLVLLSLTALISSSVAPMASFFTVQAAGMEGWQTGPFPPGGFQYARHDGAFVPGPALESWANKIYFPGGRTSPSTESPHIWMFDPVSLTYTDTGADVVEDVSNYNANLVFDDGTGRGPAIYVIGGTDKDHGGVSIGMVQRYYPMTNEAESLTGADNWNGRVMGNLVAAMGTVVVDDIIYVFGGWETNVAPYFSSETWMFDPKAESGARWTNLDLTLHTARSYIMSAVQDGKIYSIGGVGIYNPNDPGNGALDPVDTLEVLDTNNLAAGWTLLAPMPVPGGEGRAYGFDVDTLQVDSRVAGKIYVIAANDWPLPSGSFMEYDVPSDTWSVIPQDLPTPRADLAGSYVPLCTSDPNDGLPGLWTFGGRVNESCDPPLGPTEYYPLSCETACTGLTSIAITGTTYLEVGELGSYTASIMPEDASAPVSLDWSNGASTPETTYSWDLPGTYTVEITGTNCDGSAVVTGTLQVEVWAPCVPLTGAEISGPSSLVVGESGLYTVTLTPPEASQPIDILWSNGVTSTQSTYAWNAPGMKTIDVTAANCEVVVQDVMEVEVVQNVFPIWLPLIQKMQAR